MYNQYQMMSAIQCLMLPRLSVDPSVFSRESRIQIPFKVAVAIIKSYRLMQIAWNSILKVLVCCLKRQNTASMIDRVVYCSVGSISMDQTVN